MRELTVGIEIHAELLTKTKMFCGCRNTSGGEPNTRCCPVCLGEPGTLPVLNRKAVEFAAMAGLAFHCRVNRRSVMARKNYFYPDLPKGYQISQHTAPICEEGYLDICWDGKQRRVGIERIHLEEDAGKLEHEGDRTKIDYNRCGVPLIEIVSKPELHSPGQVKAYLKEVRLTLLGLGICDCRLDQGSMRFDLNVSLCDDRSHRLGQKCEIKNVNSFRNAARAVERAGEWQNRILDAGGEMDSLTLRWDSQKDNIVVMRQKETHADYRYMPEPDLPPIVLDDLLLKQVKVRIPESPGEKREYYQKTLGLSLQEAEVLLEDRGKAVLLDSCVVSGCTGKDAARWILGDVSRLLAKDKTGICRIDPKELTKLISLQKSGILTRPAARQILEGLMEAGGTVEEGMKSMNLSSAGDAGFADRLVEEILKENQKAAEDYLAGKAKALSFLLGECMKAAGGMVEPKTAQELLIGRLSKRAQS